MTKEMPREAGLDQEVSLVLTNKEIMLVIRAMFAMAEKVKGQTGLVTPRTFLDIATKLMEATHLKARDTIMGALALSFGENPAKWWDR